MNPLSFNESGNLNEQLILFIHGGFTSSVSFSNQHNFLNEFHCLFVDLPEYGQSLDCGKFGYENSAQAILRLMDTYSPNQKVILVSHSYGGLVVKRLLELCPARIEKVVIGSTNIKRTPLYFFYTRLIGNFVLWLLNRKRFKDEHISWKLVCRTQKEAWNNFTSPDPSLFADIPALLLYAQYDIKDIKTSMEQWQGYFSHCQLAEIENSGHNYFWDFPNEVNALIRDFVL